MSIDRKLNLPEKMSFFLFGPRQTGKSTLITSRFQKNMWSINLLHSEVFIDMAKEPHRFRLEAERRIVREGVQTIFVDEVQRIPSLLNEVHALMEKFPDCRFILTGSSARKLRRGGANLLAGRALEKHLFPLTQAELGKDFNLEEALTYGTLPSLLNRSLEEKRQILSAYVNTYLREEIQSEGIARNLGAFSLFLDMAAAQFGELINFSAIGRECRLAARTVQSYYEILEDTLIGFRLMPWRKSIRKRLMQHPKFYFFDMGVTNAVNRHLTGPPDSILKGRLFVQFLLLEIRARIHYLGCESQMYFWRTSNGAEVDLILEKHGRIQAAIEFKSSGNVATTHLSGLRSFREEYPDAPLFLVCGTANAYTLEKVDILPWQDFLDRELDVLLTA